MKLGYKKTRLCQTSGYKEQIFPNFFSPKSIFTILSKLVITNSRYNAQIWPVPDMFVKTKFYCIF